MTVLDILASIEHPRYHAHPHFYSAGMIFLGGGIVKALRYIHGAVLVRICGLYTCIYVRIIYIIMRLRFHTGFVLRGRGMDLEFRRNYCGGVTPSCECVSDKSMMSP